MADEARKRKKKINPQKKKNVRVPFKKKKMQENHLFSSGNKGVALGEMSREEKKKDRKWIYFIYSF